MTSYNRSKPRRFLEKFSAKRTIRKASVFSETGPDLAAHIEGAQGAGHAVPPGEVHGCLDRLGDAAAGEGLDAHGLDALGTSDLLMRAAQVRAEEMAATGNYSHVRPDGRKYYTVTDCSQTTENIHRINQEWLKTTGKTLAEAAVDDWAASQGHLDHMMSKTVYMVGVGIAEGTNAAGEPCWYCVQEFCPNGYAVSWVDDPALS